MDTNTFAEMALRLHNEPTVQETVDLVLDYALKAVAGDHAGVVFVHRSTKVETVAATGPLVEELDRLQMELGQGPALGRADEHRSVLVEDTLRDRRWPTWTGRAAALGIRSLLTSPLESADGTVGTLILYGSRPKQFDADDQAVAHVLARHAAVAISAARREQNLWLAVDARKRIGQAQGILMERYDLTPDQAFSVLVRYSQHNNIKLRVVAEQLVETRSLPE